MKTKNILILLIGVFVLSALVFQNCKKEDEPNKAPSCEITAPADGEEFTENEIVTITVAATDSDGTITEVIFTVDGKSKGSDNSAPYEYDWNPSGESLGNHTIKATSFDNGGASTSDEVTIGLIAGGNTPVSAFTASPTSGGAPLTVNFTDQSTNNPTSWLWDFGDGSTSTEQNPSNTYNDAGTYTVALTVTNEYGTDTKTKNGLIAVSIPAAEFSSNTTGGTAPFTVVFSDESLNNPTSWQWDFGDGGNSTEQNPSYTYNNWGQYDVTLTSTNEYGSDTETKTNFITVNSEDPGSLTDGRDGQTYKIIDIDNQTWFAENLNYETSDSWCYDDNPGIGDIYGRLYTWDAANTACPVGWHLPSDDEWKILEGTVDSQYGIGDPEWDLISPHRGSDAGRKLKSAIGWNTNNGLDNVGFTGLPGGYRMHDGSFYDYLGNYSFWWSATESGETSAFNRSLAGNSYKVGRAVWVKGYGISVRCIKND